VIPSKELLAEEAKWRKALEPIIREQAIQEAQLLVESWICPRNHYIGMNSCDYCDGFFDSAERIIEEIKPQSNKVESNG